MIRSALLAIAQMAVFAAFAFFYIPLLVLGAVVNILIETFVMGDRK